MSAFNTKRTERTKHTVPPWGRDTCCVQRLVHLVRTSGALCAGTLCGALGLVSRLVSRGGPAYKKAPTS